MEPLRDPCGDRAVKTIPPPPAAPLSQDILFPKGSTVPDWRALQTHLFKEGRLTKETLLDIIKRVSPILSGEPNLLVLKDPITVVGDIHGQFYDFVKMLEVGGDPSNTQYLFLGDYVDRGSFSVECLLCLLCIKLNYPKNIWMLRGNHECRQMTAFFNFRDECEYKYDQSVYYAFMELFDLLPLAATINGKFFAVHGGLSPELTRTQQILNVNRFQEPPRNGLFCDLLWSDPVDEKKEGMMKHGSTQNGYVNNEVRGCSYFFTYEAVVDFLDRNGLLSVIRAHEAQLEGYKMHKTNDKTGFPTVITIFSAPNYCDVYNNKGAVLKFQNNTLNILQFNSSPHPYHLPNFMDVFTWSIPFVSEKVVEMLYYILNPGGEAMEDIEVDISNLPELPAKIAEDLKSSSILELAARLQVQLDGGKGGSPAPGDKNADKLDRFREKVRSVSRMMKMFKTLRQENESVVMLKGMCPGHRLPPGVLLSGKEGLSTELDKFNFMTSIDLENEKRPDM